MERKTALLYKRLCCGNFPEERVRKEIPLLPGETMHEPDKNGVDLGANINTLTSQRPSPLAKGNPQHTNLVEIKKV